MMPAASPMGMDRRSVVVAALAVHVSVLELLGGGLAHLDDFDVEAKVLAGHRVVEVDIDHAHADFLHGHRARGVLARGRCCRDNARLSSRR